MNLTTKTLRAFFGWCALCNYGILLLWFALFVFAGEWQRRLVVGWGFEITPAAFASLNYAGMMIYETGNFAFQSNPVRRVVDYRSPLASRGRRMIMGDKKIAERLSVIAARRVGIENRRQRAQHGGFVQIFRHQPRQPRAARIAAQ